MNCCASEIVLSRFKLRHQTANTSTLTCHSSSRTTTTFLLHLDGAQHDQYHCRFHATTIMDGPGTVNTQLMQPMPPLPPSNLPSGRRALRLHPNNVERRRWGWHPPLFHPATSNVTGHDVAPSLPCRRLPSTGLGVEVVDDIPPLPPPLASTRVTDPYDYTRLYHCHRRRWRSPTTRHVDMDNAPTIHVICPVSCCPCSLCLSRLYIPTLVQLVEMSVVSLVVNLVVICTPLLTMISHFVLYFVWNRTSSEGNKAKKPTPGSAY